MPLGDPFDLSGRTAVVTGASKGIGLGIATGLVNAGASVVGLQRNPLPADLVRLAEERGSVAQHVPVDLSDPAAIDKAVREVLALGEVDILVNNAGTQIRHDAVDFPLADFDTVLNINLRAVFQLCRAFAPPMLARGWGRIVNLTSLLSYQGGFRVPAYAASKGAVGQLTKALSNEWVARGVNVNAVAPGYIDTDKNEALIADPDRNAQISGRIPAGRWGTGADLAGAVVFLSSDAAAYVSGIILPVDGGWLAR
jgi:2-deoxy-D-gluconate 3-dehydrogenase